MAEGKKANAAGLKKSKNWMPLESNPDLMNSYLHRLGVSKKTQFHEIYGVDDMLLGMVPQPVKAVLMLFPISEASEKHRREEEEQIKKNGQRCSEKVFHVKQSIGNACGTIGLVHAVCNNVDSLELAPNGFFAKFIKETQGMDSEKAAEALETNDDIEEEHKVVAAEAKSNVAHEVNDNLHFNVFTLVDGDLYELDGRKQRPINHGKCDKDGVLAHAVKVVKGFMARDPKDIRFNLVAMV